MSLVLIRKSAPVEGWLNALASTCPDLTVHVWPETGPVEDVEFVLTWAADPGVVSSFPNLRAIFSLGAGVDHILKDNTVPDHLPVARMIDPSLADGIVQYLMMMVLRQHRQLTVMERNHATALWRRPEHAPARIGVMGLGELGSAFARAAVFLGYQVSGWSRSRKQLDGVECHAGREELAAFLAKSDILVSLLPRTAETDGILCAQTFGMLPKGAFLINAGRGEHLVDSDLIAALDEGQLSGAVLDVFTTEPLPPEHPFWTRSDILVTPHIASATNPATAVLHVAENIRRARAGERLVGDVDRHAGY